MSETLSNGSFYSIAASYAAAIPFTALTNASSAVATAAAHGLVAGDIVEVKSGWTGLDQRLARIGTTAANTFALENIDTTSTSKYSAGGGIGSVRKILTWIEVAQVTDASPSGGDQNYAQWVYIKEGVQRQKKTFRNARLLTLTLNDDASLACYDVLNAADEDGIPRGLRLTFAAGGFVYYNCDVGFDDDPLIAANEVVKATATFSQVAKFIRYES